MSKNEKDLSDYIDSLNAEKKPESHEKSADSAELEELFDTVRQVRCLKETALPDADYPKKLARILAGQLPQKALSKKPKHLWFIGTCAAAVLVMAVMLNFILPFGRTDIVYAMEQAFQEVKAYHGFLEIVETNAGGKETLQAKLEVWTDKEGHYYVKGLNGSQDGLITVNNGLKKWQIKPDQKQVNVFSAFPDTYRFTFELGKEVEEVKNAMETKAVGEETVAGRKASVVEVTPKGGVAYRIWIDKETNLPLQKQSGMQNALQYRATYTKLDISDAVPEELITYNLPAGFEEVNAKPEQIVTDMAEAQALVGFTPMVPGNVPAGYNKENTAVDINSKIVKLNFSTLDKSKKVVVLQNKSAGEFKPVSTAVIGKVGGSIAEIQSPIQEGPGVLGGGPYSGVTDVSSIRWQQDGFEYAVVGNAALEEIAAFIESLVNKTVEIPSDAEKSSSKPQIEVAVDLEVEGNEQKSVDAGHSPWRLDPAFVAQVFVSLKISPQGINGEYPVKYEEFNVTENTGKDAVVEISDEKSPVRRVYLKRLIRQDPTGIWTVVGYDPAGEKTGTMN